MLKEKEVVSFSKFISYVLRHDPDAIGIVVDEHGWTNVNELITKANVKGRNLTREILEEVVERNDKKRFVLSEDGLCIRAAQGHSLKVDLQLEPRQPPEILFHGTFMSVVESIRQHGLNSRSRNHVHLSIDAEMAKKVGMRHGSPFVFRVRSGDMWRAGSEFYLSENGVWLTKQVIPEFLEDD